MVVNVITGIKVTFILVAIEVLLLCLFGNVELLFVVLEIPNS